MRCCFDKIYKLWYLDHPRASTLVKRSKGMVTPGRFVLRLCAIGLISVIFLVLSQAGHEMMHALMVKALGGTAQVIYNLDLTAKTQWQGVSLDKRWIILYGGGIGTGILFLLIWIVPRRTPTKYDTYLEAAAFGTAIIHIFYGVSEGLGYSSLSHTRIAVGVQILALIVFVFLYRAAFVEYMTLPLSEGGRGRRFAQATKRAVGI